VLSSNRHHGKYNKKNSLNNIPIKISLLNLKKKTVPLLNAFFDYPLKIKQVRYYNDILSPSRIPLLTCSAIINKLVYTYNSKYNNNILNINWSC